MTAELKRLLAHCPVFSSLSHDDRERLVREAACHHFQKGEWVAHYGDVWPYLFIIEQGAITAFKESREGRTLLVARFEPGEIFWGLAFFLENASTPAGLHASEASQIHLWSRECLLPILLENGQMSWELTLLMVRRMLRASDIVEGLAFQPVAGRLAGWLLEQYGGSVGDSVARDVTLDEIAAHIGTTREMVCRALCRFAEEGAVQISRTEFTISDSGLLERYTTKTKG
jgi:CRP-like cAMP-binding protein